jgi:hypothetical protein
LVVQDALAFVVFKPMIARNLGVVFVDFAVALLPVKVFALADPDPANDATGRDFRFLFPVADVVNDFIANVMGNPLAR